MLLVVIIIVVVVSLILGPVFMMRPTPAQKIKEHLRLIAHAKGIRFSVKNLPKQLADAEKPEPVSVYFFAPTKKASENDWLLLRTSYQHDIHFLGWWAWQGDFRATEAEQLILEECLPLFPESIRAVSNGSQGVCVYWQEKGGEPVLLNIIDLLQRLKSLQLEQ